MSKENLYQFISKVADSEELQAKIGEEIDAEALIALGAECGCEFTAEELRHFCHIFNEPTIGFICNNTWKAANNVLYFNDSSYEDSVRARLAEWQDDTTE